MDLEQKSIKRIKLASEMSLYHYEQPLVCTYSGGKDSDVMLELFRRAEVPYEVRHSLTTADAPQTVYHVRDVFRKLELQSIKCTVHKHEYIGADGKRRRTTMWNLIPEKGIPPTRLKRYCCLELKESGTKNRMIATGIRWGESRKRKERELYETNGRNRIKVSDEKILLSDNDDARRLFEKCQLKAEIIVNPIIDWKNRDIWEYINQEHISTNPLYQCGYNRVGCIGCPMAGKIRWREFADFPRIKNAYIHAFDRMLKVRKAAGKDDSGGKWKSGYDVFLWWMEDDNVEGQMSFDDFPEVMP